MTKKYDIVAVTGEYTNAQGETKKRYLNVGAVMAGENGPYLLLDKTFNPAGLAEPDRQSIILGLFEPKPRDQAPKQAPQQSNGGFETDIPFSNPYKGREYSV